MLPQLCSNEGQVLASPVGSGHRSVRATGEEQEMFGRPLPHRRKAPSSSDATDPGDVDMGDPQPLREVSVADRLLLTPEEAAEVLRVGRTTVYALMKSGDLRPVHIGRSCRISQAELDRYVRRLEASSSRPQPSPDAA